MAVQKTASRASQVVLLLWPYYSSLTVLIGAGFTRRVAERRESGRPIPLAAITMISGKRNQAHRRSVPAYWRGKRQIE